jgi:hypothetical protein
MVCGHFFGGSVVTYLKDLQQLIWKICNNLSGRSAVIIWRIFSHLSGKYATTYLEDMRSLIWRICSFLYGGYRVN